MLVKYKKINQCNLAGILKNKIHVHVGAMSCTRKMIPERTFESYERRLTFNICR